MTVDSDDSQRTEIVSSGQAPPGEPPTGRPDRVARPARSAGRTWWVLPYCVGALAVFVVAGLIIGLRHTSGTAQSASPAAPMPAEMFPDTLFGQLTADIQAGNETAFLGLASATARPALTTWWENLRAIGFTTGAVIPTASIDAVHIDSHGNGATVVLAGAHSPLDSTDLDGKPQIPMELYRIGLHFAGPGATGQITSWQPLGDDPWDQGSRLYVRKAAHVVVVGLPGDRALVDQTLPVAEAAANYDIGVMHLDAPGFLQQQGFVVFVSGSAPVRDRWFATNTQPPGWPPQFLGAQAVQLPGPRVTADTAVGLLGQGSLVNAISNDSMGGVRVVVAPGVSTVTLVGEFMLDIQATQDEDPAYGIAVKPVPSWTEEGLAVAVQSLFEDNPIPLSHGRYTFTTLTAKLRGLPASYRNGHLPSTAQLFGPSLTVDEDWGYVAASTYEYIHSQYDLSRMIVSAMELYVYLGNHATPFANVYKSGTNANNIKFFGIHSIGQFGWRPWLARF